MVYTADVKIKKRSTLKPRKKRFLVIGLLSFIFAVLILLIIQDSTNVSEASASDNQGNNSILGQLGNLLESAPEVIGEVFQTELQHDGNLTSALIIGIDSRNVSFNGKEFINTSPEGQAGTRNTDTIIQVVYDHDKNRIYMISIPRDMGVDVDMSCLQWSGSIHWVYDKGQSAGCKGGGVEVLKNTVSKITGIEIQYYGFVTLEAFHEIIDIVGEEKDGEKGIWVDNPEEFWEMYPYNDYGWESVYFEQGRQFMNSDRAIRFVRTRQFTSDWGRARRQQIFIEAVKDRVLSTDTLLNPNKIYKLIKAFQNKLLFTMPNFEEIVEGLRIAKKLDSTEIYNIVLGPNFGGDEVLVNKQPHDRSGPYYMVPSHWAECPKNEFCKIQEFIEQIMTNPHIYVEESNIFAYASSYDETGQPNFTNLDYQNVYLTDLPIRVRESRFLAKTTPDKDILLIDYTNGAKPYTLAALSKMLGVEPVSGNDYPGVNINEEEITIIVRAK